MNILVFLYVLQIGYAPTGIPDMYGAMGIDGLSMYTDFQAEVVAFDFLVVGGNVKTFFTMHNLSGFPFEAYYGFYTAIRLGGLEVGWRHLCLHPIIALTPVNFGQLDGLGSYNEIYIRFKGQVNLFGEGK